MKNGIIAKLVRHKWTGMIFSASFTFVIAGWIWSWARLRGEEALTLHFSSYTGINNTGDIGSLHAFGLLGLIILSLNLLIAMSLEERDWFLGKFTASASLVIAALIFIGFMVIMNVN